ncbi:hypothetical protein [Wolbachia endosymbiont (group B) of Ischnura elegans]|uniref:hypothetical protein n=1 Tax=Wolbachia endosymbiont (group B) of Ischnura elegans TaxID=2954021 RepID=UPI002232BBF7|nr:hypothetical protein [Wolbachia endosymbiont (group B) of Ischnura elegans]
MDTKISYARVTRRIFAFAFDHILLTAIKYFIGFNVGCTLGVTVHGIFPIRQE